MTKQLEIYLAGPDVFYPNPLTVGKNKKKILADAGFIGHFPMDPCIPDFQFNQETAYRIAQANEALMKKVSIILVNMTPWHGPSMDVGTAFEAGFMSGRAACDDSNILIIGYYEGAYEPNFTKRVSTMVFNHHVTMDGSGAVIAQDNTSIENFGLSENLMIPHAIRKTGGAIFDSFALAVQNIESLWNTKQNKIKNQGINTCYE